MYRAINAMFMSMISDSSIETEYRYR